MEECHKAIQVLVSTKHTLNSNVLTQVNGKRYLTLHCIIDSQSAKSVNLTLGL
jgi:hypothetical protein